MADVIVEVWNYIAEDNLSAADRCVDGGRSQAVGGAQNAFEFEQDRLRDEDAVCVTEQRSGGRHLARVVERQAAHQHVGVECDHG